MGRPMSEPSMVVPANDRSISLTGSKGPYGSWEIYEASVRPGARKISAPHRKPPLVLVVDDDPDHRELCAVRLAQLGCRVLAGADGSDAVRLAAAIRPDLVLMDLMMPRTDGIEAARILRADARTSGIRILAMTNHAKKWHEAARLAGCEDVLTKTALLDKFEEIARSLMPPEPGSESEGGATA